MQVRLRNNKWKVVRKDLGSTIRGQIDPPSYSRKQIKMSTRLKKDKEILEVFIHECLHGCFWDLDEQAIEDAAADLARALYKLGARIDLEGLEIQRPKQ